MGGQPESRLSLNIQNALKKRGAFVWKVHGNEYTPAGIPDIVGVFRGQFIGVETKMPGGRLSAIQEYRVERMRLSGALIVAPCFSIAEAVALLDLLTEHADLLPATHQSGGTTEGKGYRQNKPSKAEQERRGVWERLSTAYGRDAVFPS